MITKCGLTINSANMPSSLSAQHFDRWAQNFDMGDVSSLLPALTVEFSLKEVPVVYGAYSLDEAKQKIRDLFPEDNQAKAWADEVLSSIETRDALIEQAGRIADNPWLQDDEEGRTSMEQIKEIASFVFFHGHLYGEYRHKDLTIILYVETIRKYCHGKSFEEAVEEIFIHELFHAFHYFSLHVRGCDEDILRRRDLTREVVVETLASYYQNAYCKKHHIANDLESTWRRYAPAVYPYAGANYIQNEYEFEEILLSTFDFDLALRRLLFLGKGKEEHEEFYKIKNGAPKSAFVGKKGSKKGSSKGSSRPQNGIDAVVDYCRTTLRDVCPSPRSKHCFYTKTMEEFFLRHGETIDKKMYICCMKEGDKIVIFAELCGEKGSSPALDLLRTSPTLRTCRNRLGGNSKKFYGIIGRTTVLDVTDLTDSQGNPAPFSVLQPKIDNCLREFQTLLTYFEQSLQSL